jgi:hypothetical protein
LPRTEWRRDLIGNDCLYTFAASNTAQLAYLFSLALICGDNRFAQLKWSFAKDGSENGSNYKFVRAGAQWRKTECKRDRPNALHHWHSALA